MSAGARRGRHGAAAPIAWRPLAFVVAAILILSHAIRAQRVEALWYATSREASIQSFLAHARQISVVAPQVFAFDRAGAIHGKLDPRLITAARANGVKIIPLVVNPGFDEPMVHRILTVAAVRHRAVRSLVALCRTQHVDGIQFDLEHIDVHDRDAFTRLAREAVGALHQAGCSLSAAVVPRTSDDRGATVFQRWMYDNWRGVYDYKALADTLDFISYMTYAQHTGATTPGPVAGYTWMEAALDHVLALGVAPSKLSLGIPSYSDHWYPGYDGQTGEHARATDITYAAAESLVGRFHLQPVWDDRDKATYAFWDNGGVYDHLWVEDARAFAAKAALARAHGLRGYSVWVLGYEDPQVWALLDAGRER